MMNDNNRLDDWLTQRHMPSAPSHLAENIITRARTISPAPAPRGLRAWLDEIAAMIYVPNPAFAGVLLLVSGLLIGLSLDLDTGAQDLSGLLATGEEWL